MGNCEACRGTRDELETDKLAGGILIEKVSLLQSNMFLF